MAVQGARDRRSLYAGAHGPPPPRRRQCSPFPRPDRDRPDRTGEEEHHPATLQLREPASSGMNDRMDRGTEPTARRIAVLLGVAAAAQLATDSGARLAKAGLIAADARLVAALRSKVLLDPMTLEGDPYRTWRGREPPRPPTGTVCGVRFESALVPYPPATV